MKKFLWLTSNRMPQRIGCPRWRRRRSPKRPGNSNGLNCLWVECWISKLGKPAEGWESWICQAPSLVAESPSNFVESLCIVAKVRWWPSLANPTILAFGVPEAACKGFLGNPEELFICSLERATFGHQFSRICWKWRLKDQLLTSRHRIGGRVGDTAAEAARNHVAKATCWTCQLVFRSILMSVKFHWVLVPGSDA